MPANVSPILLIASFVSPSNIRLDFKIHPHIFSFLQWKLALKIARSYPSWSSHYVNVMFMEFQLSLCNESISPPEERTKWNCLTEVHWSQQSSSAQTSFYGYFIAAHVPIPNGISSIKHERLRKEPFLDHRIDVVTSSQKFFSPFKHQERAAQKAELFFRSFLRGFFHQP